ncbi:hypothetical protein BHE74_00025529 [Ensete ventricosum]|nr:hypothetical protein BHE74_00025529 [Ensete ventricosum]
MVSWVSFCASDSCPYPLTATLLVVGLATGGSPLRAPYSRPPLRASCCKRVCPRVTATPAGWPQPVVLAGTAPVSCYPCELHRPPLRVGPGRNWAPFGVIMFLTISIRAKLSKFD